MLHCRRCRRVLIDLVCLLEVEGTGENEASVCTVWHVNVDAELPEWILNSVHQAKWTVGKLNCQNCRARLGSFNFIHHIVCPCGQDAAVHLSKSRVDYDHRHYVHSVQLRRTGLESGQAVLWTGSSEHEEERLDGFQLLCPAVDSHISLEQTTNPLTDSESTTSFPDSPLDCKSKKKSCRVQHVSSSRSSQFCPATDSSGQSVVSYPLTQLIDSNGEGSVSAAARLSPVSMRRMSLLDQYQHTEEEDLDVHEEVSDTVLFLRGSATELEEEMAPQASAASTASSRGSKREKNHLKGLRRKQKRRERWLQEQTVDAFLMGDRDHYSCPICLDIYLNPHSCRPCGHVFCEPCLRKLAKNQPTSTPCPLCRTLISHTDFQKELSETVKIFFPRVYNTNKQNFMSSSSAKWPLPSISKTFPLFWGSERRAAAAGRHWHVAYPAFSLDVLSLGSLRGRMFDIGLVIVCIHSFSWILGFLLFFLITYYFFS
ncbi:E3 ubiquitin-protein ligase RNF180 isoform X2 [Thalassophryne amazonica]|uniref:E3 ubiquitin-protein ligase RNF180 isoform X2 n=1 Tax=Thalassophryne amazonica TaxID=390379 RepID=UPI001471E1D4|nr:E3 ubiquitin-protein ligase RNF180 isoform X2 [Thalassophryne amazonica]